jgi:hypothetical protein
MRLAIRWTRNPTAVEDGDAIYIQLTPGNNGGAAWVGRNEKPTIFQSLGAALRAVSKLPGGWWQDSELTGRYQIVELATTERVIVSTTEKVLV